MSVTGLFFKKKKGETGGKNNLCKPLGSDLYYDVRRKNN